MNAITMETIEAKFALLPAEEKAAVITHGAALRLSALEKRLFLAESKVRHFQEKYQIPLPDLESEGLPDDANYEMHEDYIMWRHWADVSDAIKGQIASLSPLADQGLYASGDFDVSK